MCSYWRSRFGLDPAGTVVTSRGSRPSSGQIRGVDVSGRPSAACALRVSRAARVRTAARGSPASPARGSGKRRAASSAVDARRRRPDLAPREQARQVASRGRHRERVADALQPVDLVGCERLAAPAPQDGPELRAPARTSRRGRRRRRGGRRRPAGCGRPCGRCCSSTASRTAIRRSRGVVLDDHRHDVDRPGRPRRTPGPCPRRTARRAGSSAGRSPSRSPRRRARPRPRGGRASRPGSRRAGARRGSACRSRRAVSAGSGSGQTRVTVHEHRVVRRGDDPPDDLDLAVAQRLERGRAVDHGSSRGSVDVVAVATRADVALRVERLRRTADRAAGPRRRRGTRGSRTTGRRRR